VRFLRFLRPTLIDRYIVHEILPPTGLGLLLFTFILLLQQITLLTGILVSRGADFPTILRIFANLLPSIFSTTIPMAFLLGVLLAFGRLASDSEIVAFRASGVSGARLLRPVVALATVATCITLYVMAVALPKANQTYREVFYSVIVSRAKTTVKPRIFFDDLLPGMVLYVSDVSTETGEWKNVFIHDVREPKKPQVILAKTGRLVIDDASQRVQLSLKHGTIHAVDPAKPEVYESQRFAAGDFPLSFDTIFKRFPLSKGDREMSLHDLSEKVRELRAEGRGPKETARFEVEWHKKFAIPFACMVFGLLGLGLSLGSKKEARSAAFGLSIAVIFVYYVIIRLGEQAGDTGMISPWLAMWGANIVLGAIAVTLLVLNHREAAFDPLDPMNYRLLIPRFKWRQPKPEPRRRPVARRPGSPAGPGTRTAVVLRLPRLEFPIPGILDRYILRQYAGHLSLVLSAFWSIYFLAEFLDLFDDIQQNHVKGVVVFHYYAFHAPFILNLTAPVGVLVAVLITYGVLSRRNEITAMKAGGLSLYRVSFPTVAMGFAFSLGLFSMGEFLLPHTNKIAAQDFNVIKGRPPQSSGFLQRRWILGSDGRFYNYEYMVEAKRPEEQSLTSVATTGLSLYGLSVYDVSPKTWEMRDRTFVSRAGWNDGVYELDRGWRRSFGAQAAFTPFENARTREFEAPSYFKKEERDSDTLRFDELRQHIASLESLGLDVIKLKVQLNRKVAFPLVALVMTLIGIPFAFVVARRGALYGIALSIVLAIVYWACLQIFEALGNNALLPPLLAAWAPNLLFGAAGLYLMLTLET
jgi:LPS export ABC transporter permease LptF/LPS export ABC transporter permease LptG